MPASVTLPADPVDAPSLAPEIPSEGRRGLALLVEDDPPLRKLVAGYLKLLSFAVAEAADGKKAMAALAEQKYDLICLDLMLPDIDGLEVCRRIREHVKQAVEREAPDLAESLWQRDIEESQQAAAEYAADRD